MKPRYKFKSLFFINNIEIKLIFKNSNVLVKNYCKLIQRKFIISSLIFFNLQQDSDMNGGPSQILPSISEDDENVADNETAALSPSRSLHASPRHGKFSRYIC